MVSSISTDAQYLELIRPPDIAVMDRAANSAARMEKLMDSEVKGTFKDRRAAELALEHLVQEIGIDRTDIFIAAHGIHNTSGTERSGGDAQSSFAEQSHETDPHLEGEIEMSIGCSDGDVERVVEAVRETGGRVL